MTWGIALSELSLFNTIDGEGCDEDSIMGWFGFPIWCFLAIYLMVGQFVICEEYFVPVLAQLGDRWKMAEDVQGATLLAVGSSSPELFTAMLGVIFYPEDNPGPGTNVGSAVFNMCIIVGLSAIFAPRAAKLSMVPFLRDSLFYMFGLIELYLFYAVISSGVMELWESALLVGWWIVYVFFVYRTDLLASRCCCCIPSKEVDKTLHELELEEPSVVEEDTGNDYRPLNDNGGDDVLSRANYKRAPTIIVDDHQGHRGVLYDARGHPVADYDQNPDNIRIAPGARENMDDDLVNLLDELNRKQRQNVNKGWVVVVMPTNEAKSKGLGGFSSANDGVIRNDAIPLSSMNRDQSGKRPGTNHAYVRRRTLMETIAHEERQQEMDDKRKMQQQDLGEIVEEDDDGGHGHGSGIFHKFISPWVKLFHCTLPAPEGDFAANHIFITIAAIITWLGVLTFFVVDACEKIGGCMDIPGGLLGITLLAIGSSLPDCISSVIVARQMKIDMAVANAFGSNIFDVNLCVGFGFILGSIYGAATDEGTEISLGDETALTTFSELILAAAGFMVFLWIMMWCTIFRLEKWIGYVLLMAYVGYICVFTTIYVHNKDDGADEGES